MLVQNFVCGSWSTGSGTAQSIFHAVTGEQIAEATTGGINFREVADYARSVGGPNLRALTFHERAVRLKQLALYLTERKEELYSISEPTGATRTDSWIDIEGGIGTFFAYSSRGRRDLPNDFCYVDGAVERLSKNNSFAGQHICVPLEGVAVHINAFNFPCWGMLEKLAPTLLAGMPAIVKPATCSCYVAEHTVRVIADSGILPPGSLQILCGSIGDLFDHLTCQDVVTFTGSKSTGIKLRQHPQIIGESVRFNMETDSLNCSILGPDAAPGTAEFELYIKELVREMTVKAGQKCTVIRRAIIPKQFEQAVIDAARERLAKVVIGNPRNETVRMGALISKEQVRDVGHSIEELKSVCEIVAGGPDHYTLVDADGARGAFMAPTLLRCEKPLSSPTAHSVEAFGPVSTLMAYDSLDEAIALARMGDGSLVGSLFTADDLTARKVALGISPYHGRLLLMNAYSAKESTGHGSPLPNLVHGGPGRAGGGEELGGIRSVMHYMQRTALQGSPQRLTTICNQWIPGSVPQSTGIHPFRKYFEELHVGESLLTATRVITDEDVAAFAKLSGDYFYVHTNDQAAKESIFGARVAHGYFVLSAAAGLFVDPAPGPVLANYGLENLRFVAPVFIGDSIQVRLTCKQKTPRYGEDRGVVSWDVEVSNQKNEPVAIYTLLTLVKRKELQSTVL
ncbi:MAG: phenylacetic acid degradation bifunctional protein PaaZ [Bdellovibrionota bacterium]